MDSSESHALAGAAPGNAGWRSIPYHPCLLAVFPVLTIWAGYLNEITLVEGYLVLLVAPAGTGLLWLGMQLIYRDVSGLLGPAFSPVNTFRLIFREYFGADLDLLPDRHFYWEPEHLLGRPALNRDCQFVDVTDDLVGATQGEQLEE